MRASSWLWLRRRIAPQGTGKPLALHRASVSRSLARGSGRVERIVDSRMGPSDGPCRTLYELFT